ncbi:MAG: hypothetical protein SFV20_00445 [Sphingopyxis sp.]|nr:hypothetical protein [Sphingopyxis sp.]
MRALLLTLLLAAAVPAIAAPQPASPAATMVVERTYLKAAPGVREALAKFIVANWFAMDRTGLDQGLFTFYRLSENLDPVADWDFEVAVGYPTAEGYQNRETQGRLEAIRQAHTIILIDGKGLRELGRIVRTDRIRPREGS